ncbi:MAG: Uma2 family endonuclease [Candidatus Electrothrix sp. AR1]|nr:Uma2 family endonuclease [Candidatus Electrothrix sp. AR1]
MPNTAYLEHYTADDYAQWEGDWELIYGAPYAMSPSPSITHQRVAKRFLVMLDTQLEECSSCEVLSEVDWHCADDIIVRPDIVAVCDVAGEKLVQTPELIIEVISPSTVKRDEQIKLVLYQEKGVKTYILVYPQDRKVVIYQLAGGKYRKVGEKHENSFAFQIKNCPINLAFDKIWQG